VFPEPSLAGKKWSDSPQMVILSSENLLIFYFGKNMGWLLVSTPLKNMSS
jgi:hypothetical protein